MSTMHPTHISQKEYVRESQTVLPKPTLKVVELKKKITLKLPKNIVQQIQYLCNEISEVEWSGILMYKLVGNFSTGNFYCVVKDIYPMNVGSGVYTEYEFNSDFIKHRMETPDSLEWELGHVH